MRLVRPNTFSFEDFLSLGVGIGAFCLLSIWALPGTIGLRHILIGWSLAVSVLLLLHLKINQLTWVTAWPLWLLLCLYPWLVLHLIFFSTQASLQAHELLSIWMRSLGVLPLGLALGLMLTGATKPSFIKEKLTIALFLGFLSTPIIFISHYLYLCFLAREWLSVQSHPWWMIPYLQKPPFVIATALLLPLCCALLYRSIFGNSTTKWAPATLLAIALCLASNYLTNTKNGIAIAALTLGIFFIWCTWHVIRLWTNQSVTKRLLAIMMIVITLAGGFLFMRLHIQQNSAWEQLISDIKVGVDIDRQHYWKDRNVYPTIPLNDLEKPVNLSTYERSAWFTAGLRLLEDKPLGFGLVHHSFGWMAKEKWSDFYPPAGKLRGMTHSGWLDLALGIGLPGLFCILTPLAVAWYRSLRSRTLWGNYATWAIPTFSFAYLTTEITGAHHFIELLIFVVAFFIGLTLSATTDDCVQSTPNHS